MSSRKKLLPTTPLLNPNPLLSDDLLLSIFARVSRLYYPTLSLVSKSFRSLLTSPELYKARSLLNHTENCLYVCLWCSSSGYRWLTLCRKPKQTLTNHTSHNNNKKKKSSGYVLATVSIPNPPHEQVLSLVAVGSNIYNIGGIIPSYGVSVLDCRSHTWCEAPSLRVKLSPLSASIVDRKIYVIGKYKDCDSDDLKNAIEVFDTKTKIWDHVPIPNCQTNYDYYSKSVCIDGMFHIMSDNIVDAYNAKEGRLEMVASIMTNNMLFSDAYCAIENVLYFVLFKGTLGWYDTTDKEWREVMGLVELPKFTRKTRVRLANYGGKMVVMWDKNSGNDKKFWCVEIAFERRGRSEIWGNVEWFDHVLTIPRTYVFDKILTVTL